MRRLIIPIDPTEAIALHCTQHEQHPAFCISAFIRALSLSHTLSLTSSSFLTYLSLSAQHKTPIKHPCLPKGATLTHNGHELAGDGDWLKCKKLQRSLFDTSSCGFSSCSFGGAYQPALPSTFYGFSYLYDRTAAIGLLDHNMQQFGEQKMSIADIERAGMTLCATEQPAVASRFASHQDASKSSNFCGDVAYVTTLLSSFGFSDSYQMTMTNKIKDVELVWTLGAMLAKSAELANEGGGGSSTFRGGMMLLAALGIVYYFSRRSKGGYRHVSTPLHQGHESD